MLDRNKVERIISLDRLDRLDSNLHSVLYTRIVSETTCQTRLACLEDVKSSFNLNFSLEIGVSHHD